MNITNIIEELNQAVSQKYSDCQGIYHYGSTARGVGKEDSDIDLVVMFKELTRVKELELCELIGNLEYKYDVFIDFQALTPENLKRNPYFYNQVANMGTFYATR